MAKLYFLKSVTDTINTSFILESNGVLLVVDGGYASESPCLYEYLKKLGGHVTAWFITHFHNDHFCCLLAMLNEHPDIAVDGIYYNFPRDEFFIETAPMQDQESSEAYLAQMREAIARRKVPVVEPRQGDVLEFDNGNVIVRIIRTYAGDETNINDTSMVLRFEADGKSILFLGDLGVQGGEHLLKVADPSMLRADYVQMAHHGQDGVSRECYEAIRPAYCLWATPTWLWDNMGPGGYDTGNYLTVVVRGWISSLRCVKKHYLMQEGPHVIDLAEG